MFAVLGLSVAESAINAWVDLDASTRLAFNQLQGKLLRIVLASPVLSVDVLFDAEKIRLSPTALGMGAGARNSVFEQRPFDKQYVLHKADVTLQAETGIVLAQRLLQPSGNIPVSGDMAILQSIQRILTQAKPDIGYALTPWLGDMAASRVAAWVGSTVKTVGKSALTTAHHAEDWLSNDSQLFAPRWQFNRLTRNIQNLQVAIDRAVLGVQALEATLPLPPVRE